jgi:hypothetical protein
MLQLYHFFTTALLMHEYMKQSLADNTWSDADSDFQVAGNEGNPVGGDFA